MFLNLLEYNTLRDVLCAVCGVTVLNMLITFPIIFNFFIIPKIEARVGRKLEFNSLVYCMLPKFLGVWIGKHFDIACSIFSFKLLGKLPRRAEYTLNKGDYDIGAVSRFEVVMSFLDVLNGLLFFSPIILKILQNT
jgi:hypothetical protein